MAVNVLAGLLFAYLVVGVPIRGRLRFRRFRQEVTSDPAARLCYYRSALRWHGGLAAIAIALYMANGHDGYGTHLVVTSGSGLLLAAWFAVTIVLGGVLVRWRIARPARRAKFARGIRGWAELLPRSNAERRAWLVVAIGVGVTEEILYRAFVMICLVRILPDATALPIVPISAAAFGLAHLYQGPKGVALTALMGTVLATVFLSAGLVAAMVLHALIDLRVLVIPPEFVAQATETDLD